MKITTKRQIGGRKVNHVQFEHWYVYDTRRPIVYFEACFPTLEAARKWTLSEFNNQIPEFILITSINHHYTKYTK